MAAEGLKNERPADVPQGTSQVPSTQRVALARSAIPSEWLDKLLVASLEAKPSAPLVETIEHLLGVVAELVEDAALGVRIPGGETGQIVVRLARRTSYEGGAPGQQAAGSGDPGKLFPELDFERIIPILLESSSLHVATNDEDRFAEGSAANLLLHRLAQVLGQVIRDARAHERTKAQAGRLLELSSQLIQSEKLASLGQIAAGIVHELNNPLTTIVAYSDYLKKKLDRGGSDPADVKRLSLINEAAERILRFSRDLTAYSRPAKETPAPIEIHDVIDRALGFCEHEFDKTGVLIERNFGEVPLVRGVPGQLTQVFVNLFTNAAHAMRDQGGMLSISTGMSEGQVEIAISDDGHGIDEDTLPRIFDPFFTTKTDGTGTGLGLSIVRNIMQSHGGDIRAAGNSPKGTVFVLALPTVEPETSEVVSRPGE